MLTKILFMDHDSRGLFRKLTQSARLILFASFLLTQTHCQPARYQEIPGTSSDPGKSANKPEKNTHVFETTVRAGQTRPLDMTWIIDNSGSMTEEATHVRKNFGDFIATVQAETDLKLALISRAGSTGRDMKLPVSGPHYLQINRTVESTDSLEITASAICPTTPLVGGACETLRKKALTNMMPIAGSLRNFLRQESKKAFVFVTDDRSRVPSTSFMTAFSEAFPGQQPVIYGFIGLDKGKSPCAAAVGTQYSELATTTAGAVFNICDQDWTAAFKQLASHVVKAATAPIPVPEDLDSRATILSVELNGVVLDPSDYTLTPEGLVFSPNFTEDALEITVRVEYQLS